MSEQKTRRVKVLTTFTDREGTEHEKDSEFVASYANERQRRAVNEMIHRGFLIFAEIVEEQVEQEEPPADPPKPPAPAPTVPKQRRGGSRS